MISKLLLAVALAVQTPSAEQQPTPPPPSIELTIPEEFKIDRVSVIKFVNFSDIEKYCGKASPGRVRLACGEVNGYKIVMPNPCLIKDDPYAFVLCHELAHNNGWSHD